MISIGPDVDVKKKFQVLKKYISESLLSHSSRSTLIDSTSVRPFPVFGRCEMSFPGGKSSAVSSNTMLVEPDDSE